MTTFFPLWSSAFLCLFECKTCPLNASYKQKPFSTLSKSHVGDTYHPRNRWKNTFRTPKASRKDDMLDVESPLGAVSALDNDVPFGRGRVLSSAYDGGGCPYVELESFGVACEPVGELLHVETKRS